jgi:hypothetical protein
MNDEIPDIVVDGMNSRWAHTPALMPDAGNSFAMRG